MKLRNKKTGETGYLISKNWNETVLIIMDRNEVQLGKYNSLAELNAEWEDYEEPKEYWYLSGRGDIRCIEEDDTKFDKDHREIGNYFATKEEAEKAVEKLKAWKRLKDDYHIRFNLDFVKNTISFTYQIDDTLHSVMDDEPIVFEDMKTIFGGKE